MVLPTNGVHGETARRLLGSFSSVPCTIVYFLVFDTCRDNDFHVWTSFKEAIRYGGEISSKIPFRHLQCCQDETKHHSHASCRGHCFRRLFNTSNICWTITRYSSDEALWPIWHFLFLRGYVSVFSFSVKSYSLVIHEQGIQEGCKKSF